MQTEPIDKNSEFESLIFWVFLHDSNDSTDLVWNQALGKALSERSPIAIYRALISLKETSLQEKEVRIINDFQTYSPCRTSYDNTSLGENTTSPISFSLVKPYVPVTFAKIKCGRYLAKDFNSMQGSNIRSFEESLV